MLSSEMATRQLIFVKIIPTFNQDVNLKVWIEETNDCKSSIKK